MYILYIDHVLFPVAPEKITMETENDNKILSLVDGSFVVALGGKGLKKISFELLLPMSPYPFASYENGFRDAGYFLDELNRIAGENKPVWFDVYRTFPDMNKTYLTNIRVVMESITIVEDAVNGMDMKARIVLREYRNVETKIATEKRTGTSYNKRASTLIVPSTHVVEEGDSVWTLGKKYYGDMRKGFDIAEYNNLEKPYRLTVGDVIKIEP